MGPGDVLGWAIVIFIVFLLVVAAVAIVACAMSDLIEWKDRRRG